MGGTCATCKGTGLVPKKVWESTPVMVGIHPAILAGTSAQRTVRYFPCTECWVKATTGAT